MQQVPPPSDGSERKVLLGWLAFQRGALESVCQGLSDEDLTLRSASPSNLTLQGVIRRVTELEDRYLVQAIGGRTATSTSGDAAADRPADALHLFHHGETQTALQRWSQVRALADELLRSGRLTDKCPGNGLSLRWNLMNVVGEYARHLGHAELLRVRIDGGH